MNKAKKITITYMYLKPKTPQEKEEQQRRLDAAYDMIFRAAWRRLIQKSKGTRT